MAEDMSRRAPAGRRRWSGHQLLRCAENGSNASMVDVKDGKIVRHPPDALRLEVQARRT